MGGIGSSPRPRTKQAILASLLIAGMALGACRDGLRPELRGASVRILLDGNQYDEQTVAIGDVLALSAQVLDATGEVVPGETVAWRSDRPEVATVEGDGVVVARGLGTARIIALHAVGEDTALVNVAAPVTGPLACEPATEVRLAVGEAREFAGPAAVDICLPGGSAAGAAEYVIVAVNTANSAASVLPLKIHVSGVTPFNGPRESAIGSGLEPVLGRADVTEDVRFHGHIRTKSSQRLEPLLRRGGEAVTDHEVATAGGPNSGYGPSFAAIALQQVGQTLTFNGTIEGDPCDQGPPRTGVVRRITQRAIIVEDTANPAGGFDDEDYAAFGDFFDQEVWPLVTSTFGTPSDIDRNGRVIIFFTVAVNDLPGNSNLPGNTDSFIGGFFYNRDLFSTASCAGSNRAEMFYLMVPDPSGQPEPGGRRAFSADFVRQRIPTLLVHEFQHLVNDSRRLHINRSPVWEQTWLNEGLSHIAEELMFFRRAGLEPGSDLGAADLDTEQAREAFRAFQLNNLDRLTAFLMAPSGTSPIGADLLATRGAIWSFLRYAADRYPQGETVLWQRLVRDSRLSGLTNLAQALGSDPQDWIRDWAVAMYLDGTGLDDDPRYQVRSWNFRDLYAGLGDIVPPRQDQAYPLDVRRLERDGAVPIAIEGGGTAYMRAGVPPDGRAAIRVTVGGTQMLPPPKRLKIIVVRVA